MTGKSAMMLLACLVGVVLSVFIGLSVASQDEGPCDWRTYELARASSARVASFRITGTGTYCGNSIRITVAPTIDLSLRIRVEPGTVLHSSVPGEQDMVVRRVRGKLVAEWRIEPSVDIEVECGETETYILEAYCLDLGKDTPSSTTEFTIGRRVTGKAAEVIAVLPVHEEASIDAVQTAIWVATEDISLSSVKSSDSPDDRQANEILTSAGFGSETEPLNVFLQVLALVAAVLLLAVLNAIEGL